MIAPDSAELMTAEGMAAIYPKTRMLKKALKEYETAMNAMLESGDVVADGKRYSLEDTPKDEILFDRKTLSDFLPSNLVDDLKVTITKKELKAAIMLCAEKRKGASNMRDCIAALKEAGSVIDNSYKKIKITTEKEEAKNGE